MLLQTNGRKAHLKMNFPAVLPPERRLSIQFFNGGSVTELWINIEAGWNGQFVIHELFGWCVDVLDRRQTSGRYNSYEVE